jgi:HK97 family phage major capsid protein
MSATTTRNGRGGVDVRVREPLTYRLDQESPSYFLDLANASREDAESLDRIRRHEREMADELPKLERRGSSTQPEGTTFEYRAPNLTLGQGGYGTPPLWAVQLEGTYPRPERIVADLADPLPLPDGVSSINVPVLTTGTSTGQQTPNQPTAGADITDTAASSPVVTLAGRADLPLQMLEQSPRGVYDRVLFADLMSDYDSKLEYMLINGTGGTAPTGQILGLLNVSGTNSVTYTSASPTGTGLFPSFGSAFGVVSDTRKLRPEGWVMRGNRYGWLATSEDQNNRPLDVPASAHSLIVDPTKPTPIGALVGLPIFCDEELPTTLGTAGNQDVIVGFRWSDLFLWESEPRLNIFTQVLSGTLEARVSYRRYAAAILGRYPTGTVTIGGTGLVVPSD